MTEPVVTVLPTDEPDTMPHSADEITATLAGPPEVQPAMALAASMKKLAMPVRSRKPPKMMNTAMNFAHTCTGVLSTPDVPKKSV